MQQQKIVDYKLCQRLAELGYDGESHCGWWLEYNSPIPGKDRVEYRHGVDAIDKSYADNEIKAYDCWDCIVYLMNKGYDTFCLRGVPEKCADELALMVIEDLQK